MQSKARSLPYGLQLLGHALPWRFWLVADRNRSCQRVQTLRLSCLRAFWHRGRYRKVYGDPKTELFKSCAGSCGYSRGPFGRCLFHDGEMVVDD